jgi:hypothetical protein
MEGPPNVADTIRKMTEAYAEWFSVMTRTPAPGTLPWGGEEVRRLAEQWLGLARMIKEGTVSAIDQGFDLWERQARQALDAMAAASSVPSVPSGNPAEAWTENWKKTFDAMLPGGAAWGEELRKQTEQFQKMMQEGSKKIFDAMLPGGATWSEELRKQTEQFQKVMQEGSLAWQRLWQSPERKT